MVVGEERGHAGERGALWLFLDGPLSSRAACLTGSATEKHDQGQLWVELCACCARVRTHAHAPMHV